MLPGKVPPDLLQNIILSKIGKPDPDVLLGPALGEDAAVIRIGEQVIITATDPITGSIEDVGWLAVHVNANDIATFGISPRWFLATILLPTEFKAEELEKLMAQIDSAAKELDIAVTGGHSEITESITQPIVVGFMIGVAPSDGFVTSSGAKPGDSLIVTKTIGIEGTAILGKEGQSFLTKELGSDIVHKAQELLSSISVVKDGVAAFQTGFINAMHDPTEGGLANGLHELCDASDVGFEINYETIPINPTTSKICELLQINPLELISSGSMLIACDSKHAQEVVKNLADEGIDAIVIGKITEDPKNRIITRDKISHELERPTNDALWNALKIINPS